MIRKIKSFKKTHSIGSWMNLIFSTGIVACVFISIVNNLLANPTELVQEVGLKTFRMFTVLSNMFVGITAAMSIPFAVDGIRKKNYHLPKWIVNLTFVSVSCISLTFIISLFVLSPQAGFVRIMATRSNLFLHTIVPITSIISFLFINTYHNVKFKTTIYAMMPILMYAMIYLISAIFIGEENGGWRDHYHFEDLMPWYYVLVLIVLLSFGLSVLLRTVHNRMHRRDKAATEFFYHNAPEYDLPTIEDVIKKLANENKQFDKGGDVIVPRRIIIIMERKYNSKKPLSYLCGIYLDEYMK